MKLFRRRGKADAKAAGSANAAGDAGAQADDAKAAADKVANDTRVNGAQIADASSTKGYGVLKVDHSASATVSTLANDRQETTMALSEQLIQEDVDEQRSVYSVGSGHSWDNLKHLSRREQMWYKNQMWLLEKQKKEAARASPARSFDEDKATGVEPSNSGGSLGPLREQHKMWLLDRQGKNDARGTPSRSVEKYYGAGVAKHTDSPKGVDEFEATPANEVARKSLKEMKMRFRSKTIRRRSEKNSLLDDDTRTQQSSSMFADEDTRSNQSTEEGTNQTSTIIDEETMGSATLDDTLGSATIDGTQNEESDSLFASLQESASASMSYVFELIDDDDKRGRKYKLGEGRAGLATKPRKGATRTSATTLGDASTRRVTGDEAEALKDSASYVDPTDEVCPIIPYILEEMRGWRDDTASAVNQVMYAFFISPDDIDRVSDRLRDAKLELAGMHRDKPEKRRHSARYL